MCQRSRLRAASRAACPVLAEGPVRQDVGPWRGRSFRSEVIHDRGPQIDAEERIRSAHRAIEIREKRRGPLVAFSRIIVRCPRKPDENDYVKSEIARHVAVPKKSMTPCGPPSSAMTCRAGRRSTSRAQLVRMIIS